MACILLNKETFLHHYCPVFALDKYQRLRSCNRVKTPHTAKNALQYCSSHGFDNDFWGVSTWRARTSFFLWSGFLKPMSFSRWWGDAFSRSCPHVTIFPHCEEYCPKPRSANQLNTICRLHWLNGSSNWSLKETKEKNRKSLFSFFSLLFFFCYYCYLFM